MADLEEVKVLISSVLLANPLETTINTLSRTYLNEIGEKIPFSNFGFSSLEEFLRSIPQILEVHGSGNNAILKVVVNEKVAHLDKLIQNQRISKKGKRDRSRRRSESIHIPTRRSSSCKGRINNYYNQDTKFYENRDGLSTSERPKFVNDYAGNSYFKYKTKYPHNVLRFDESIPKLMVSEIVRCPDGTQVNIGSVYDPSKFYIILNENFQALDEMMDDMQQAYAKQNHALRIDERDLKKGIFCVSVYNGEYHRGLVKKVTPEKHKANIFFVDYGIMDVVDTNQIYFLKKIFSKFPRQAIRATLSQIVPVIPGTPWSIEARNCFIDIVNSKILNIEKCKLDEKHQVLEFFMFDNTNGEQIFVNKELVNQKFAERNTSCSGDGVCTHPSFEEIEEDLTTPPLSQKDIMTQFQISKSKIAETIIKAHWKDKFIFETQLFEHTVHVVCIHKKFYIALFEVMILAKLQNTPISLIWRKITDLRGGNIKFSLNLNNHPKLYYDLQSCGLKSGQNESFSLISVDFVPQFFRYFSDAIFPSSLFENFLRELNSCTL